MRGANSRMADDVPMVSASNARILHSGMWREVETTADAADGKPSVVCRGASMVGWAGSIGKEEVKTDATESRHG